MRVKLACDLASDGFVQTARCSAEAAATIRPDDLGGTMEQSPRGGHILMPAPAAPMSEASVAPASPVLPFHDPSRRRRLVKVAAWLGGHRARRPRPAAARRRRQRAGCPTSGTRSRTSRPATSSRRWRSRPARRSWPGSRTTASCAPPIPGQVQLWPIVTAYAVGVAMNNFLPANIGTFVTLVMFVAIIPARDVRRVDRRLPRAEDLLHDRRHVRLPLPLPLGAGLVRREPRQPLGAPGGCDR